MNITFEELRRIKHSLPAGSIHRIAEELHLDEQTVRNYFGAHKYGKIADWHLESGAEADIVYLEDTAILERALTIIEEHKLTLEQLDTQTQENQTVQIKEPIASYSTPDKKEAVEADSLRPAKEKTTQLLVFTQMESLRKKFSNITLPPNVNIGRLADEVNEI